MPRAGPARVAILIDSLLAGGAERVAVQAACALDPERFEPHLLVTRHTGPLEELARDHGLPVTVLGRRRRFDPRSLRTAIRVARTCDLLHAHKFAGGMLGALVSTLARRPLVAHEHTFAGRSRARTLGYRYVIAPRARRILCVSQYVAESLVAEGVAPALLELVPNGVPSDAALERDAARGKLGLDPGTAVIGMVGRLRPEKRHDLALEALALLREHVDAVLCIVGDGPLREELKQRAADLGVSDRVAWTGERPNAGTLMRAFDVLLQCSDYEGMPLAVLEALVAGVPVVATDVGGLPELLAQGMGRLVPPNKPAALEAALAAVLQEVRHDDDARAAAMERARAAYGLDRLVHDYERVYAEVLSNTDEAVV